LGFRATPYRPPSNKDPVENINNNPPIVGLFERKRRDGAIRNTVPPAQRGKWGTSRDW